MLRSVLNGAHVGTHRCTRTCCLSPPPHTHTPEQMGRPGHRRRGAARCAESRTNTNFLRRDSANTHTRNNTVCVRVCVYFSPATCVMLIYFQLWPNRPVLLCARDSRCPLPVKQNRGCRCANNSTNNRRTSARTAHGLKVIMLPDVGADVSRALCFVVLIEPGVLRVP